MPVGLVADLYVPSRDGELRLSRGAGGGNQRGSLVWLCPLQ